MWKEVGKKALEYLLISVFFSGVVSAVGYLAREQITPYLQLPEKVADIEEVLDTYVEPELVEVRGLGLVLNANDEVRIGGTLLVGYTLKRNASCDSNVEEIFLNVDTGIETRTRVTPSVKAPVTNDFLFFRVPIPTTGLTPGQYVYFPRITPVDCGVYGDYCIPSTEVFRIIPNT